MITSTPTPTHRPIHRCFWQKINWSNTVPYSLFDIRTHCSRIICLNSFHCARGACRRCCFWVSVSFMVWLLLEPPMWSRQRRCLVLVLGVRRHLLWLMDSYMCNGKWEADIGTYLILLQMWRQRVTFYYNTQHTQITSSQLSRSLMARPNPTSTFSPPTRTKPCQNSKWTRVLLSELGMLAKPRTCIALRFGSSGIGINPTGSYRNTHFHQTRLICILTSIYVRSEIIILTWRRIKTNIILLSLNLAHYYAIQIRSPSATLRHPWSSLRRG